MCTMVLRRDRVLEKAITKTVQEATGSLENGTLETRRMELCKPLSLREVTASFTTYQESASLTLCTALTKVLVMKYRRPNERYGWLRNLRHTRMKWSPWKRIEKKEQHAVKLDLGSVPVVHKLDDKSCATVLAEAESWWTLDHSPSFL